MEKKATLLKQLQDAANEVLSQSTSGKDIKIKFYEKGTDAFLIEKTLDTFLQELDKEINQDSEDNV
jgi:hypothetical protein